MLPPRSLACEPFILRDINLREFLPSTSPLEFPLSLPSLTNQEKPTLINPSTLNWIDYYSKLLRGAKSGAPHRLYLSKIRGGGKKRGGMAPAQGYTHKMRPTTAWHRYLATILMCPEDISGSPTAAHAWINTHLYHRTMIDIGIIATDTLRCIYGWNHIQKIP